MAVGTPLTATPRYTCTILTSDPTTTPPTIEAALKGADGRSVSIVGVSAAFRWPEVGETWVIRQENGSWYLDSRAIDPTDTVPISTLQPGQMRLDATSILDANGHTVVAAAPLSWTAPTLLNGWTFVAGSPAGYLKDALGFVHLKGRLTGGPTGAAAFLLPQKFRPGNGSDLYPAGGFNGTTAVAAFANILSNGAVAIYYAAGATDIGLGSISFLAEN